MKNSVSDSRIIALGLPLVAGLIIASCATIMHGTSQDIGIMSKPTGATVIIDNKVQGSTPLVASLSRKSSHIVRINLEGYESFETTITRSTSGWVWGNIVFGGLIGLAVDAITGGLYKLKPEQIEGLMTEDLTSQLGNGSETIFVTVVLRPEPEWELIGSLAPSR